MKRRNFIQGSLATASTLAISSVYGSHESSKGLPWARLAKDMPAGKPFKLNYAPHDGMFKNHAGTDFVDQIKFMNDQGFRAVEDNGMLQKSGRAGKDWKDIVQPWNDNGRLCCGRRRQLENLTDDRQAGIQGYLYKGV